MGNFVDLTGQRFGRLVVESFAEIKNKKTYWNCICDCGNKIVVRSDQLRNGMAKSCGCYAIDVNKSKYKDLTGQRFGKLVAEKRIYQNHKTLWLCTCDCGNQCADTSGHLLSGYKKSCGCIKNKYDLTGQRFGYWTVLHKEYSENHMAYWYCRCDCGTEKVVSSSSLKTGASKSCGCYQKEVIGNIRTSHRMSKTRLFNIYHNMKSRCYDFKSTGYKNYGGRGISICEEWLNERGFENFVEWSYANGYADNLSIDRIDVNGNYEPSNCRWATTEQQSNNKRTNHLITYKGETHNITEWSMILGIKRETIYARVRNGWNEEHLLSPPQNKRRKT